MKTKSRVLKTFLGAALALGLLVSAGVDSAGAAVAGRGNSGLPPGPGNPIAALFKRILALEAAANQSPTMWINHFDLLPGDSSVTTTFDATNSGVGGGLTGLVIQSSTTGDVTATGGNKVVHMALQVPPNYDINGVRVCYELTNAASFITQIRLAQVQDPPSTALILLDDGTDQTAVGPICVDSAVTSIDPSLGAVLLSLRVNFGNIADKIVVRGLALHLQRTGL